MASRIRRCLFSCVTLLATFLALPHNAIAANFFEMNFWLSGPRYAGVLPSCNQPSVLNRIAAHFGDKEREFCNPTLNIVGFENIRETAFRPWSADAIPRRFCSGIARASDGGRHEIYYSINEDTGMIGMTWGVDWCVAGLDRDWAYNPACKLAQP